jgi:hypothetical protein
MNNPTQSDITSAEDGAGAIAPSKPQTEVVLTTFPQEITVRVSLKIRVNTQDERDAYLIPGTNNVDIGVLADVFDNFMSYSVEELLNVNGVPREEVMRQLAQAQKF